MSALHRRGKIELLQASKPILIENNVNTVHKKGKIELRYPSKAIQIEGKVGPMHKKGKKRFYRHQIQF